MKVNKEKDGKEKKQEFALLLDFGASRIKSVVANLESGALSHSRSEPALSNLAKPNPNGEFTRFEFSLDELREKFFSLCNYYIHDLGLTVKQIMMCSEMHGLIILNENNQSISNYISWKDSRSLEKQNKSSSTYDELADLWGDRFKKITGMRLRPSLPFANFVHFARTQNLKGKYKLISLPEWLALCAFKESKKGDLFVHETMIAGSGFYDLYKKSPSAELLDFIKDRLNIQLKFNQVTDKAVPVSYFKTGENSIPIYTGVGDHQCAVLGAGNLPQKTLSVNIGTGSQVSAIDFAPPGDFAEVRPYFNGSRIATVTHIPGGRALSVCIGFLESIAKFGGSSAPDFWDVFRNITVDQVLGSSLEFNLSFFPGAWKWDGGGSISMIQEGQLTLNNYLASLLKSLTQQYAQVIEMIDPERKIGRAVLSGGIPQKLPQINSLLSQFSKREVSGPGSVDETFSGLLILAGLHP